MKSRLLCVSLVIVLAIPAFAQESSLALIPPPGPFRSNVTVRIEHEPGTSVSYRFEDSSGGGFIPYVQPFELTALPGEERPYRIVVRSRDAEGQTEQTFDYLIDRNPPEPPVPDLLPGLYRSAQALRFPDEGDQILYALDKPIANAVLYEGEALELQGRPGERVALTLRAYRSDAAGNQSDVASYLYTIDRPEESRQIDVRSPISGSFANEQLLLIEADGFSDIRYSLDGSDPAENGTAYEEPFVISGAGGYDLRVSARSRNGELIRRSVSFEQGNEDLLAPPSGVYAETVDLVGRNDRAPRYLLADRSPSESSPRLTDTLSISPPPGERRVTVVRAIDDSGRDFRYTYLMDGRLPAAPEIIVRSGPDSRLPVVSVVGPAGSGIRYTLSGNDPTLASQVYRGPFELTLPENTADGEIVVSARSFFANGRASETSRERIFFDTQPPSRPQIAVSDFSTTKSAIVRLSGEQDASFLLSASYGDQAPTEGGSISATTGAELSVSVPYGMEERIGLRFAARDEVGNVSPYTDPIYLDFDRKPPMTAQLSVEDGRLSVSGEGRHFVRVLANLREAPSQQPSFSPFDEAIELEGIDGERVVYRAQVYSVDEAGNRTPLADSRSFIIDRRRPSVPSFSGVSDGMVSNATEVLLEPEEPTPGLRLHYELSRDGSAPPEPTIDSPLIGDGLLLEGEEQREIRYRVSLLPSFSTDRVGDVSEISVTIDRLAPDPPQVSGLSDGQSYPAAVRLTLSGPSDSRLFYVLQAASTEEDETVSEPVEDEPDAAENGAVDYEGAVRYREPVRLSVPEGEEQSFVLRTFSQDPAGNRSSPSEPIRFEIDRSPPDRPTIVRVGEREERLAQTSVFAQAIDVDFRAGEGRVFYELTEDGSVPSLPTANSPRIDEPIRLAGEPESETRYLFLATAVDDAGNESPYSELYSVTIDQLPPEPPREPTIRLSEQNDRRDATVSWRLGSPETIFYHVGEDEFRVYTEPVDIPLSPSQEQISVSYYQEDAAGNQSDIRSVTREIALGPPAPALSGAENGARLQGPLVIEASVPRGEARFEVSSDDEPDEVTRFSNPLPSELEFEVAEGQEVQYTIRARTFSEDGQESPASTLSFVLDRRPPPPPQLAGAAPGAFYQDARGIQLNAPEGRIFFAVEQADTPENLPTETPKNFAPYDGSEIRLEAGDGEFAAFRISAYAEDQAGNRSREIAEFRLFIDKAIIYVNSERDEATGDGSRANPLSSIAEAIESLQSGARQTIFLATGNYTLPDNGSEIDRSVSISGGLDPNTWEPGEGAYSAIVGASGLEISGPNVRLSGLRPSFPITVTSGSTSIVNSQLSRNLILENGELRLQDSESRSVELIAGRAIIEDSILRSEGSTSLRVRSDAHLRFQGGEITGPGIAPLLQIHGGSVELRSARILQTGSSRISNLVEADGGELGAVDSVFHIADGADVGVIVRASNSSINFTGGELRLEGGSGRTGISAVSSDLSLERVRMQATDASAFVYGLQLRGGSARLVNVAADFQGTFQGIFLSGRDVDIDVLHNTIRLNTGDGSTHVALASDARLSVLNSIFAAPSGVEAALSLAHDHGRVDLSSSIFDLGIALANVDPSPRLSWNERARSEYRSPAELDDAQRISVSGLTRASGEELFEGNGLQLRSGAPAVDAGSDAAGELGITLDINGDSRPVSATGEEPHFDIGAYERLP